MSAEQIKTGASSVANSIWELRIAIFLFLLFSVNSLCMITIAALAGCNWSTLSGQAKFMIYIAILGNWTGVIMAFVSKQSSRIKKTGEILPEDDNTTFVQKTQSVENKITQTIKSNEN